MIVYALDILPRPNAKLLSLWIVNLEIHFYMLLIHECCIKTMYLIYQNLVIAVIKCTHSEFLVFS